MDLAAVIQLIGLMAAIVGVGMGIEKRLSRIEAKLDRCPHVNQEQEKGREAAEIRG